MTRLSKKDRIEAEAAATEIHRRPAFHLACVWLERARRVYGEEAFGQPDQFQNGWVDVDRVLSVVHRSFGGHVLEETMLFALEHSGFKLRNTKRGIQTNVAERVLLDYWASCDYGKRPPRVLTEFSDPTDAQMAMH